MANLNNKIARINVLIGGADQAKRQVEDMKKQWAELGKEVDRAKAQMDASVNTVDYDKNKRKYEEYLQQYKQLRRAILETERNINTVNKYLSDLSGQTLQDLGQARKALNQMLRRVKPKDLETLNSVRDFIRQVADEAQRRKGNIVEFSDVIGDIGTVSEKSLSMVKQRLQDLLVSTKLNEQEMQNYRDQLKQVEAEEQRRVSVRARSVIGQVQSGTFSGTIGETKEAVRQLEVFKQQLKTADVTGIKEVDDAILKLNGTIRQASASSLSLDEALEQAANVRSGSFKGTYEDLERLKKTLTEYKSQVAVSDTRGLADIHKALSGIEAAERNAKNGFVDIRGVMDRLKTAPIDELKAAAAQLQESLNRTVRSSEEFITKSAQLRQVNAEIDSINKSWKEHDNAVMRVIKRLSAYVAVYGGFNMLLGMLKQMTRANLDLSDSLADIQKTTGLSAQSVAELSKEVDALDTRTSQKELHDLAYEAGKLGISAKNDVLQFVKAGNQLITALGEDLGGAEAVRGLMKINDLLGETKRLGVEKALLATGSAINELSQTSTASAGPIAEIVSRLGAVGAQARLSMADLAAFGSTADALGQEVEVSGTAISKFVTALQTNTHAIAQSIGVTDESLQDLMKTGKTMDAVILVLQRLRDMGGLQETNPIMKEFGSDGDRLKRVIGALAQNVDVLEQHVRTSNDAFRDATSVTNEYNIKNESAMALVQRLGNMIKEAFVNSGFVSSIKGFLQMLMQIPAWIQKNYNLFMILTSYVSGLTAALLANRVAWIKNIQAMSISGVAMKVKSALIGLIMTVQSLGMAFKSAGGMVGLLTAGVNKLRAALYRNWLTLLIGSVTAAAVAFYQWKTRVSETAKALADFNAEITKERMQLDALFSGIENTNLSLEERKKLIDQINKQYSPYLGFMLNETDSAAKLAAAHDLINSRLRERIALQLQEKMTSATSEKYGGDIQKALTGMSSVFAGAAGITGARSGEAVGIVQDIVSRNITRPMDDILAMVKSQLERRFNTETSAYGSSAYFDIQGDLKDFISAQQKYRKELGQTDLFIQNELKQARKEELEAGRSLLNEITAEYDKVYQQSVEGMNKEALKERNEKLLALSNQYLANANKLVEKLTGSEKDDLEKAISAYQHISDSLTPKNAGQVNVWGEGLSLESASVDQLVAKYKQLFDERKTMREDAKYDTVYSRQFSDRKQAMQWYLDNLDKIKKRLNEMGYNEKGNFLKDKSSERYITFGGTTKTVKEINDESTAALSALEAYYNREKGIIQQAYLDREITEEEMNRRLLKKDNQFLNDRIELRKKLLGKENEFDQTKYKHTDSGTGEVTDYFSGKDLGQLSGFIQKMGERMTDGMLKQLTVDELKVMQAAAEHMKKIEKIILDNDFTGQVQKQYQDELEVLELFWGKDEDITQEGVDKRMAYLRMLSRDSYKMDSAGLQQRMTRYAEFGEWMKGRSAEDYQALLLMLQKYYDDTEEAENREMARRKRIADKIWTKSGREGFYDSQEQADKDNVSFVKGLNSLEIAAESNVDDAELQMYRHRMEAAQAYYDLLKKEGADLTEAERKRSEAMSELSNKEMEITMRKLETLKSYTDAVVDFSEQMGEAAFGEVSDRKDAAKQLLKTTMQLTKNLIMEEVKRMIMRKMLASQDIALTQSTEAAKTAAEGSGAITSLTLQGAKTTADTALGISSGAAKTIGQLGWWGIPLIAVISAALSALMGLAMGKMNKAKEEIASTSGVSSGKGRVAAGMLTYAQGDYPVLGNDGKVYNASYQKDLKTGVYGGGAHFGIFSEKKPEMIVDGETTQKLILNYPHIYDSILTIANHGRLKSAMPTFAEGNYPSVSAAIPATGIIPATDTANPQMQETLSGVASALDALTERLKYPIDATIDPYGKKGAVNTIKTSEEWMRRKGLIK